MSGFGIALREENRKPVIIIYAGKWDSRYDTTFLCTAHQRYNWNLADERERAIKLLGPPLPDRFQFMQTLAIDSGMKVMNDLGMRFLRGRPKALDDRKNYATQVDVDTQRMMVAEIKARYRNDGIAAEEGKLRRDGTSGYVWTLDPLDAERQMILEGSTEKLVPDRDEKDLRKAQVLTHVDSVTKMIEGCFDADFPRQLHREVRRVWMWGCGLLSILIVARGTHHLHVQR